MAAALRFQESGLSAGGVPLLGAFDLALTQGVLTLLTGPNGAGKSSLLRWVANSAGAESYLFAGELGLRAELSVFNQALFFAQLFSSAESSSGSRAHSQRQQLSQHVNHILSHVGLLDWSDEKVGTLSSGQRVRLGLCGLLLSNRKLWLLDEPLNALDNQSIELLALSIAQHLNAGGLVLMASHADVGLLTQFQANIRIEHFHIQSGNLMLQAAAHPHGSAPSALPSSEEGGVHLNQPAPQIANQFANQIANQIANQSAHQPAGSHLKMLLKREWSLVLGNPQSMLWAALFHWMILTFFGLSLIKSDLDASRGAIWVSSILAILLLAKDWFSEDQRCGWMGILVQTQQASNRAEGRTGILSAYWLSKVVLSISIQIVSVLPVALIAAVQFGLNGFQMLDLLFSLALGLAAAAPLLALVSLMVLMTRGGAVLVYVLALPLLVPVMVFGLEGSQAQELGRSTLAPWLVLGSMACLGLLLGPWLGRRLMILIQE
ncbi:MAG: ATP-binding cassette domain-containing protein [Limnobacter sp.]|nr:ATP-binding cassette domain-containing protein [Limnobacter sp.]